MLLLCLGLSVHGEDSRLDVDASDGRPASTILSALATIDPLFGELQPQLLRAGRGNVPITLGLVGASAAGARQAMAHALGVWWDIDAAEHVVFCADARVIIGKPHAQVLSSVLACADWAEPIVEALMAPWISDDAGISYEGSDGTWAATLDDVGHNVLQNTLSLLEGGARQIPSLIPDSDARDPNTLIPAVKEASWAAVVRAYVAAGVSISVAPSLVQEGIPQQLFSVEAGRLETLPRRIRLLGIQAAMVRGVLCLAPLTESVEDRQHPAKRRQVVLLPLQHLITRDEEGVMLAAVVRDHVAPWWWSRLGAGVWYLDQRRSLLVAADIPTIHAVLRALALIDRHGLTEGLRKIEQPMPPQ